MSLIRPAAVFDRLRAAKDQRLARTLEKRGVAAALRLSDALRDHARALGAVFGPKERLADLSAAVELKKRLDRANQRPRPRAR